eukprot:CAMPEP_0172463640 /NCGR_PEP_ID=MMETSP1065-20121228/47918_1 /TAXON_ID=265537 /ORGANISM="Amphiprora paludosa, Strain CCMP125" /LENGTH=1180 /DNA_ID=CAMNT_0013219641 /DNA_START=52 /DNA_END=3594 /DNA_ORIENTATION=+
MSFGGPSPDEAAEIERQLQVQEEYRRQHMSAAGGNPQNYAGGQRPEGYNNMGAPGPTGAPGMPESAAASQYYARHHQGGHPHAPYGHHYGAPPPPGDPPAGFGPPTDAQLSQASSMARMYAEQQRQYPHSVHGMPPGYPYGHMPHDPRYGPPSYHQAPGYGHEQPGSGGPGLPPGYPTGQPPHGAPPASSNPSAAGPPSSYQSVPKSPVTQPGASPQQMESASPKVKTETGTPGSPSMSEDIPETPETAASPKASGGTLSAMRKNLPQHRQVDNIIVDENGAHQWFTGCVPLGLADDKYWLSELQVYLRSNFAEAFGATEDDIAAPMHGRNKPIVLGQVGIRCMHCKHDNPAERGQQATSYPSQISGIYNSVQQMLRLHLDCCLSMPGQVRSRIEQLRLSCSSRGGRKQYWVDSAKRLGLQDTPHGIHFGRDPTGPLPPLTGPSVNYKENRKKKLALKAEAEKKREDKKAAKEQEAKEAATAVPLERPEQPPVDSRPLVYPEDKQLISDYLYLTLEQMAPCMLMEADRVGCYKTRSVGFPGLACKHCVGQAGCGRYFPASEASLSQTTTSQTIMNHVRNCRRCPIEIRENLEIMKRNRMGPDGKRADKPKHGGRKVFFHRLWCRIQGIPFEEGKGEQKQSKKKKLYKKPGPVPKNKKKSRKQKNGDSDDSDSDTDTEDDASVASGDEQEEDPAVGAAEAGETELLDEEQDSKPKAKSGKGTAGMAKRKAMSPWYEGCVRLTKADDSHWLTEMEVFARSDLVEAFSLKKTDVLDGYNGRKEPAVGQVGIRCVFCKHVEPSERSNGAIAFPDMLSSIHSKVSDMILQHFPTCPSITEEQRAQFDQLKEKDAKGPSEDSQQYWVDSARDIGLANIPPDGIGSPGSWGVTFRRDPLQPSPADELDLDSAQEEAWGKNLMVRPADRGLCTDHVLLMLCQVRPCRFRKSDRRAGPGSRGRDRAMGFPGLACMHCANKNSLGRYFPVSAKNLTDNTANSLQAHISACSRCPEHIQASLAYLSHRSILQKAELSGSWKKAFFRKVWDRLHTERTWTALEDEDRVGDEEEEEYDSDDNEEAGQYAERDEDEGVASASAAAADEDGEAKEGGDGEEKEEVGDQMNALIKAAAIWLTEQDQAHDPKDKSAKSPKSRALPAKRSAASSNGSTSGSNKARGSSSLPTKRRRGS